MINITNFGNTIKIRGRNKNKKRYVKEVSQKPYFYVPSKSGEYTTIYKNSVKKVEFKDGKEKYKKRDIYSITYEDNVPLTIRYMIDNISHFDEEPVRICFLDIETEDRQGFPEPSRGDKQILSIACYDSFTEKYYLFLTSTRQLSDIRVEDIGKYNIKIYERPNEISMLGEFINFVNTLDFDLFYAWNGNGFDYPYIVNRMKYLQIDPAEMSPYNKIRKDRNNRKIDEFSGKEIIETIYGMPYGRSYLDLMEAYKKLSTHKIESYSLDYVGEIELGEHKIVHAEKIGDMWENNLQKFILYNIHDVGLMVDIEAKKGITIYFDTIRKMTYCHWEDLLYNSKVLDAYMLKVAHDKNIILPSRNYDIGEEDPVEGGIVGVYFTGVSNNTAVGDVKSLYPSAMETCNMSPETIISNLNDYDEYCKVDDVYFRLDERGFIPMVIRGLYDLRQEYKSKMRACEFGSDEYNRLNNIQTVCKFLLNSIFGVMKFKSFRLYNRDVFRSVTYFGRENNRFMQNIIKETGHDLILNDTDSVYFKLRETDYEKMINEAQSVIDLINNRTPKWVEVTFGNNKYNCIETEFEAIYGSMLTIKNVKDEIVKKRYAGLVIYEDGLDLREKPDFVIKGFGGKRSDTPPKFKNLQKELFILILNNKKDEAVNKLKTIRNDIINNKYSVDDIALPLGMSKNLYEYDRPSAGLRGAMFANTYCGENIKQEKIKYVYIKEKVYKPNIPRTDVIAFTEIAPDWVEIDVNKMAERLIDKPYANILYTLGYNIDTLKGQTSLFEW